MKKICVFLLACALLFAACASPTPTLSATQSAQGTTAPASTPTLTGTVKPTPTPAPTPTAPAIALRYDYLEEGARTYLGKDAVHYTALINAVLAREESIAYTPQTEGLYPLVLFSIFTANSPLRALLEPGINFSDSLPYTIYFTYKFTPAKHKQKIVRLESEYKKVLTEEVLPGDAPALQIMAVHRYFSERFAYDYSFDPVNDDEIDVLPALETGLGVCHTYAYAVKFALIQLGFEVSEAIGFSEIDEDLLHAWLLAKLDGQWYHFDPTFENGDTQGTGLFYFALTDAQRLEAGGFRAPYSAGVYPFNHTPPRVKESPYSFLHDVIDWERTETPNVLLLHFRGGVSSLYDAAANKLLTDG